MNRMDGTGGRTAVVSMAISETRNQDRRASKRGFQRGLGSAGPRQGDRRVLSGPPTGSQDPRQLPKPMHAYIPNPKTRR